MINVNGNRLSPEEQLRYQIQQRQVDLFRQNSIRSTKNVKDKDLESRLNRLLVLFFFNCYLLFIFY
jgi:hypothetical protein